jgi:hypothetical protein
MRNVFTYGRALPQAVSRWPFTVNARVRARGSPCGICGNREALGQVYVRVLRFLLSVSFHRGSPHHLGNRGRGLHKGLTLLVAIEKWGSASKELKKFELRDAKLSEEDCFIFLLVVPMAGVRRHWWFISMLSFFFLRFNMAAIIMFFNDVFNRHDNIAFNDRMTRDWRVVKDGERSNSGLIKLLSWIWLKGLRKTKQELSRTIEKTHCNSYEVSGYKEETCAYGLEDE